MAKFLPTKVENIFSSQDGMAQAVVFTVGGSLSRFCVWISSFPAPFIEETKISPLCVFGSLVKDQLNIHVWVYFWASYSVTLFYK